jgi:hypothetical protein
MYRTGCRRSNQGSKISASPWVGLDSINISRKHYKPWIYILESGNNS